jgi:hypothetical protein
MKSPPRLRLEPRPTRLGWAVLVVVCSLTSMLVAWLPLSVEAVAVCAVAIIVTLCAAHRRLRGRDVPALLLVGIDRRITVHTVDGSERRGSILDASYVGEWLTSIVWRADGDPWWRPARSILVLPDTLQRDEFRALRVMLRYGRPVDAGTSALDAG